MLTTLALLAGTLPLATGLESEPTLTNLTVLIAGTATARCPPHSGIVADPTGSWNSDLNQGAGGKYVYLCATYAANGSVPIGAIQAAGLTSKYKPNCNYAMGFSAIQGNLNEGSKNPGSSFLCIQGTTSTVPITRLIGASAGTGCPKDFRAINSVESPATAFNFDPAGSGVVLCAPAPRPPLPPTPPPGPRTPITDLRVLVIGASSGLNASCPKGFELVRQMGAADTWDLDFNSGAGGDYAYLCVGRNPSAAPILSLLGFHTPSAADPFEKCPGNYTKVPGTNSTTLLNSTHVGANDLNHGSRNVGAMYLCYRKDVGAPFHDLAGLPGGGNTSTAAGCTEAGWQAIHGPPAYPRLFNFDPSGIGLILCANRTSRL